MEGRSLSLAVIGALSMAGCAAQNTTDYEGESLFSMVGRVEAALDVEQGPLLPAIAFMTPQGYQIEYVDAEVSGEFPASFQIDVYAPPPAAVIGGEERELAGEPGWSIGFIAAVTADHLTTMHYASVVTGSDVPEVCDDDGCTTVYEAATSMHEKSGMLTVHCPPGEDPISLDPARLPACAIVERTGDPMLVATWKDPTFAGAAANYAVLYLDGPAPAGGLIATRFHAPEGLAAGYHLMTLAPPGEGGWQYTISPVADPKAAVVELEIQPGWSFALAVVASMQMP